MSKTTKLLNRISDSLLAQRGLGRGIFRVSLHSTQAQPGSSETLYQRLQRCYEQGISIIPALDKWVVEGREMDHEELKRIIRNLKRIHRFKPALEIAKWISDMEYFDITPGHIAVQLVLISKVHGVEQAENYFNSLKDSSQVLPVYAALLNCYADAKSLEKAEAVMEEIRKLNLCSSSAYNTMLSLYSQMGKHEKLDPLMQEMEDKGILFDEFTYNIRLNAYADSSDIEGMEKLLMKMEVDPLVIVSLVTYVTAAKGYLKAGGLEKASVALKKAEHLIKGKEKRSAYGSLITFYAMMKKKEDVYRLWNLLKRDRMLQNRDYVYMITSLEKLDDLDGARKILEEWEEKHTYFDIRIPSLVICAYCKKGCVREAESILNRLLETGKEPSASTWSRMSLGYYKSGLMDKAVEMTKKAILASFPGWKPDLPTVAACLEYLKKKGDVDGMQEILMLLENCGKFSVGFKEIIEKYAYNAKTKL